MSARLFKGGEFLLQEVAPDEIFAPEDFSDEQREIARTTEQFVASEITPRREDLEHHDFPQVVELMHKCGELGLLMIDAPEEYGGLELDKVTSMLVAEKIAAAGSFSVTYSGHTGIGTLPLVYYGTREQKDRYLARIVTGELIGAYCLTEPDSGSDALAARTSAVLSEDGTYYLLNGTKQFITNGGFADIFTIFAKVDKVHFTAFLVERGTEGLSIGPEEKKLGIKGTSTTQVILDNARVPVENLLGEIGKGHKIALNVLNIGRLKLGAGVTGVAKCALADGLKYANSRKQFGVTIGSFGAIREKIADQVAAIYASESLVYRLAGMIDSRLAGIDRAIPDYYEAYQQGIEEYAPECAISKVFCSEVLADTVDEVVQIFGGYGYIQEYPAERYYRDERINRIFEGTNEINRLLVTGMLLGRARKGELPLARAAEEAFESLMTPTFQDLDESVPLAREQQLVAGLKTLVLLMAGAAVKKYQERLKDEQELLMALADQVINLFALESALLRALKAGARQSPEKRQATEAAVRVFAFSGSEKIATAARKAAFYIEEGDSLTILLSGIRRFTRYSATGLLQAKRLLAAVALEGEKYPF